MWPIPSKRTKPLAANIAVHVLIIGDLLFPVGFRRNDGTGAALVQFRPQPIDIECFVPQQGVEMNVPDQGGDANRVMALARQEHEARQVPQGIHQSNDFGGPGAPPALRWRSVPCSWSGGW